MEASAWKTAEVGLAVADLVALPQMGSQPIFHMMSDLSFVHVAPSLEYHTSSQFFDGLFDQPPRSHMWFL